jgi:predicted SnoaL-like aldol condensation-catalyzing enzyme
MEKTTDTLKEIAVNFLKLAARGNSREAFSKYTNLNFRHHNPHFKGDAESLMIAMEENAKKNPDKTLSVQHVLQENDLVAVHSWVKMNPDDRGVAIVHIYRFEGDRISELWDIAQPMPENSPNEYGMI